LRRPGTGAIIRAMMKLGLFIAGSGHHIAAWRDSACDPGAVLSLGHYVEMARLAERGLFDLLFTADTNATFGPDDIDVWSRTTGALRLEPLTLLSALAMVTERIGLVSTATTTYLEPYHVARLFASLDQISNGRAGWNLVTSQAAAEALNFNRAAHVPHAERYARAAEFAEVVLGLWDSWDEDAIVADKASGLYFHPEKLHFLNHSGKHFAVRGPLTIKRSPQGRPVIVHAGQSEAGRELAAAFAEVIFTVQQDLEEARRFAADMKTRAQKHGRSPEHVKIMPGVLTILGRTRREAELRYEKLQSLIHPVLGIKTLSEIVGFDLSPYPLDGPLPELRQTSTEQVGRQKVVLDLARRENLTLRQLYLRVSGARAHRAICGTAAEIADSLEEWYSSGAADGFNIMPLTYPEGLEDIVGSVIPELQRRGLFRRAYEGRTLRENLGLPVPQSRWAARR
jgi:N-acetyl-S-(2-succino)cysteine monooxygenase